jgi:hypothetical protein
MRFTLTSLPTVLLVALSLWGSFYEWGVFKVVLALAGILESN